MNLQDQIKWASQFDWFVEYVEDENNSGFVVTEFQLLPAGFVEVEICIDSFEELKAWAGF